MDMEYMTNDYIDEFKKKMSVSQFESWMESQAELFMINMTHYPVHTTLELREWLEMFLLWCEYEDNKNGN